MTDSEPSIDDLALSSEFRTALSEFLDEGDRNDRLDSWLLELGLPRPMPRVVTRILLPVLGSSLALFEAPEAD